MSIVTKCSRSHGLFGAAWSWGKARKIVQNHVDVLYRQRLEPLRRLGHGAAGVQELLLCQRRSLRHRPEQDGGEERHRGRVA